jgi:hypothetical protein
MEGDNSTRKIAPDFAWDVEGGIGCFAQRVDLDEERGCGCVFDSECVSRSGRAPVEVGLFDRS